MVAFSVVMEFGVDGQGINPGHPLRGGARMPAPQGATAATETGCRD